MRPISLSLLLSPILYGCGGKTQSTAEQTVSQEQPAPDSAKVDNTAAGTIDTTTSKQPDDTLRVSLTKATPAVLNAKLDSLHPQLFCAVNLTETGTLTGTITPEGGGGNIRFSQIYLPDGSTDGPFGQSLSQAILQPGLLRLRIGPSQMAENPYRGKFTVKLTLR